MIILAIDTALAACSAALYDSGVNQVRAAQREAMERGHAEALAPMVREVMAQAGTAFSAIDRIAVTIGPGTFTGLRIGLSFALGLGVALDRPVIGVTTLMALAANVDRNPQGWPIAVAVEAKRGNFYVQVFSASLEPLSEPCLCTLAQAVSLLPEGHVHLVGSGSAALVKAAGANAVIGIISGLDFPRPEVVARLAVTMPVPEEPPRPLYLRQSDARLPAEGEYQSPSENSVIIKAEGGHAAVLATLHRECFPQAWDAMSFTRLMAMPGSLALIAASAGNEPLGFLMARKAADEAEILTLGVRPAERRRQLATRLVSHAAKHLAEEGARRLYIEVAQSNTAALALYSKLGFASVGVRENYYNGSGKSGGHAFTMALPLRNG